MTKRTELNFELLLEYEPGDVQILKITKNHLNLGN
jgi:hypothetical protein